MATQSPHDAQVASPPQAQWTQELQDFVPHYNHYTRQKIEEIFDSVPIREVREKCVVALRDPGYTERFVWFEERIRAYVRIGDFDTVIMLLRGLVYVPDSLRKRAFDLIIEVFESILNAPHGRVTPFGSLWKDITVIFCGHLGHHPEDYNPQASTIVLRVLQKGQDYAGWASDDGCRILARLIAIAARVKDVELAPVIEEFVLPMRHEEFKRYGLKHQLEYFSISKERLLVDAQARQTAAYLHWLSSGAQ